MLQQNIQPFPMFSGIRSEFPAWSMKVIQIVRSTNPTWRFGATGLILLETQYNAQCVGGQVVPFNPPEDPGPQPPVPGEDATQLQLSRAAMLDARWTYRDTAFKNRIGVESSINDQLQRVCLEECLAGVKHPEHGLLGVNGKTLFAHMFDTYATMSLRDLDEAIESLKTPYSPTTSMAIHLSKHVLVHHMLQLNNNPLSTQAKIKLFHESLKPCGLYTPATSNWFINHASVAQQAFDGEHGIGHCVSEYEKNLPRTSTAAGAGYAAAAHTTTAPLINLAAAALPSIPISIIADVHAFFLSQQVPQAAAALPSTATGTGGRGNRSGAAGGGGGRAPGGGATGGRGNGAGPFFYCWSHGLQTSHLGSACRNKLAGHDDSATWFQKNGGSAKC